MAKARLAAALVVALGLIGNAQAHKPSYTQGGHGTVDEAFPVADPDVSIVLYHQVTCDSPYLWMAFPIRPPYDLFVQLGVPEIDRLSDYRPSMAILAPGLPEAPGGLPFDVPEGYGALVIDTDDVTEPEPFFEPFTQSSSWIVHEETYTLDEEATGYIVAWHPERETGKLWVAVGTVEQFGPDDAGNFEDWFVNTQTFHEINEYAPETEPVEGVCEEPKVEEPAPVDPVDPVEPVDPMDPGSAPVTPETGTQGDDAGCSGTSGGMPMAATLALFALVAVRRRRSLLP